MLNLIVPLPDLSPSRDVLLSAHRFNRSGRGRRRADDLFNVALDNMPHGLCMFDRDRRLILCNPAYVRLYALPASLTSPGTPLQAILDFRRRFGNAPSDMTTYFDVVDKAVERGTHAGERVALQDGRVIQITHNPMADGGYVATHEDVTAHVRAEERIRYLASHDPLTGLWNRPSFCERIEALCQQEPGDGLVAVHYLDLDRFKVVNDTLGHHAGDRLVETAAQRFLACTGPGDSVGRIGGDEFAVLQAGPSDRRGAGRLAARLVGAVNEPFDCLGHSVSVGVSIGIATCVRAEASAGSLLRDADVALYRAKLDGRNRFRFFDAAPFPVAAGLATR